MFTPRPGRHRTLTILSATCAFTAVTVGLAIFGDGGESAPRPQAPVSIDLETATIQQLHTLLADKKVTAVQLPTSRLLGN